MKLRSSTELPSLLPIIEVAEALLHVRNGDWFLCLLVANVPDSFNEGTVRHVVCIRGQYLLKQLTNSVLG